MPRKVLRVAFPEKCIGCEMCVFAAARLKDKVGLSDSPIKILKSEKGFDVHLDPHVNELNVEEIARICPTGVFSVEEASDEDTIG